MAYVKLFEIEIDDDKRKVDFARSDKKTQLGDYKYKLVEKDGYDLYGNPIYVEVYPSEIGYESLINELGKLWLEHNK